jgi:acyl-CoA thioesterase-2
MITALFDLTGAGADTFTGPASGPAGKRAYGGHLAAQALAAACRTVLAEKVPTASHVQFLRGGDAGEPVGYEVERMHDGRAPRRRGGSWADRAIGSW